MSSLAHGRRNPVAKLGAGGAALFAFLMVGAGVADAQLPIAYGETHAGNLTVGAEMDTYTFSGTAGEVIHIRLAEVTTVLEPRLRLLNPGGMEIEDTWGYTLAELDGITLSTSGVYTITVSDQGSDEAGDYCVHLQRMSNPVGATAMDFGNTLSGSVSIEAEIVTYRFTASVGDRVLSRMTRTTSGLSPRLRLYGPDGMRLANQSGTPTVELDSFEILSSGAHTLVALDSPGTSVGDYMIHLQRLNDPAGAVTVAYGETHSGSLVQRSETKAYRLAATAGDRVLLRMAESTTVLEPQLRIYDANGDRIFSTWNYTTAVLDAVELPATATYTLLALEQSSDETGDYSLHVQRTHAPAGASALVWGSTVAGAVVDAPETVAYTFTAEVGDRVLVRMARDASTLGPRLQVYDPSGVAMTAQNGTPTAEINALEILSAGTYAVLAMDAPGTGSGPYYLHAQRLNDPGDATAVAYGETHAGALSAKGETRAYRLAATAGDRILVRLTEQATVIEPVLRIYDANGDPLADTWNYTTAVLDAIELPQTATYTVLALDQAGDEIGGFALHVQRTAAPLGASALIWGETVGGAVVDAPETVPFTFAADAGDRILLRMTREVSSLGPRLQVYDPTGVPVTSQNGTPTTEIDPIEIATTGTYAVLALDASGTGSGAFFLHAQRLNDPGLSTAMSFGETLAGSLPTRATTRAFRFSATAGDRVLLRAAEATTVIEPVLRIYDPNGERLTSTWNYTTAVLDAVVLPQTGSYTALVTEQASDEIGDFVLHLQRTNAPVGSTDIAFGATTTGALVQRAEAMPYRINALAGDRVLIRLTRANDAWGPRIGLYAADGKPVGSWTGTPTAEGDEVLLDVAGEYSVLVMDSAGTQFGPYALHVQRLNAPGDARPIAYGETWTGTLDERAQTRAFTFSAASGDSVVIQVTELTTVLEPVVRLYDPSGVLLASTWNYTVATIGRRVPAAGTYTILVLEQASDETGDFQISLVGHATAVVGPPSRVSAFRLHEPRPNPFNPSTVLAFDLPRAGHVVVDVFTLDGRRIVRLVDESYPAGQHEVVWRGEDGSGRRVASGVYLCEVRSGPHCAARKMALVQ